MRRMSFALTKRQYLDHTKTVTRRMGWLFLVDCKPKVHRVMGVEKAQGLKKGEKQITLGPSAILSARREHVYDVTPADVIAEGFPDMTMFEFVEFFCAANRCKPSEWITRIAFQQEFEPR